MRIGSAAFLIRRSSFPSSAEAALSCVVLRLCGILHSVTIGDKPSNPLVPHLVFLRTGFSLYAEVVVFGFNLLNFFALRGVGLVTLLLD